MGVEFTEEQKSAITKKGQNILVSASAGSGKTSVLIERIVHLLENEKDLSLSSFAVMTFTRAAASQMKERLSKRISQKISEGNDVGYWQKILYELPMANITTIDSFCNSIVQNNFYKIRQNNIGLDVNYSIIDIVDLNILKNEILEEQLKEMERKRKQLLTDYFEERLLSDRLKEIILKISDFCDSEPFCDEFLASIEDMYSYNIDEDNKALKIYAGIYHKDLNYSENFEKIRHFFIKDAEIESLRDIAQALIIEVREFRKRLLLKKLEKGQISFSDLEHFALDILIDRKDKISMPSDIAKSYRRLFKYILVDEYQDSNFVQEELINSICSGNNLFLVGDLKQSIYGFRQARCELFSNRLNDYNSDKNGTVIYLSKNFRSERRILDFTNNICKRIMDGENYSIHYDEKQSLVSGTDDCNKEGFAVSCLFVAKGYSYISCDNISKHRQAARQICKKIKELYENGHKYSDIAILLRSLSGKLYDYITAFEEFNIPYDIKNNTAFLSNTTVRTLIDYLRIIDNSLQDLPLCSSMLSNIGKFTAQELVKIRLAGGKDFNDAVKEYGSFRGSKYYDAVLADKIKEFFDKIDVLRAYAHYLPLYKFVNFVVDELKIREYAASLFDSEKRLEDLKQFLIFTLQYSKDNATLSGFLHYIEKIEENDLFIERKGKIGEDADSVKLMTIHASKGLEFKIVFFAGLTSRFNIKETSPALNSRLGLGLPLIDLEKRVKMSSLLLNLINAENKYQEMEEEIRLLYVALTRAEEALILVFDGDLSIHFQKSIYSIDKNILKAGTSNSLIKNSICDYILPIICKDNLSFLVNCLYLSDKDFFNKNSKSNIAIDAEIDNYDKNTDYVLESKEVRFILAAPIEDSILVDGNIENSRRLYDDLNDKVENIVEQNRKFIYNNKDLTKPFKLSVTEYSSLKNNNNYSSVKKIDLTYTKNKGASVGTLYHKIFEVFNFDRNYETTTDIGKFLNEIFVRGIIKKEDIKEIDIEKLLDFTSSSLYLRMKNADKQALLFREKKFLYELYSKDIFKDGGDQTIIIEGIIDAYFIEDEEIVIIDYKSDRSIDPDYYRLNYSHQLGLYSRALSEAYNMRVKNCIIYSLNAGTIIL